jgi:hypothetical protein
MRKELYLSILLLTILTILLGCNSIPKSSKTKDTVEDIKVFIIRFKTDSIFQHSRIIFPLTHETIGDLDEAQNIIDRIDSKNWRYIDFKYDPLYETRKTNAFTEKFVITKNSAQLLYQGVDNGINVEFIFELKDNNWYLTRWNDLSD